MAQRLDVEFDSGGATCAAWLYLPDVTPRPVIVMAHGLGAVRQMRLDAYAERFAAAGYACLVFDYRHFGDSGGQPRQLLDIKRQLQDWAAAVAFVRSRSDVGGSSVILWGTSFSGGHVLITAAEDQRIAAVVAQCPFTDGLSSGLAMDPWTSVKLTAVALRDVVGSAVGRAPVMVATAGSPHSIALMTAPDAEPGYLRLLPQNSPFQNQVAARVALQIPRHFPGRRTPGITCPVLFCVCDTDSVAPAKATLRHAAKAPHGQIIRYPEGHFDIYVGEAFEKVVADQIDFLHRTVPVDKPTLPTSDRSR
ncbi:alpha/beta hydrolase [Mycobacterium colombiense]|uniref:alpha/beta hydrolase n=1 Tax=Mycobacterium colombiense TaxID=339268 RepID=UPI000A5D9D16|nr:alpha/beta fold hydrolase [Mycobacterium colombiense]